MNSETRNKLLNFEATPPPTAWDGITNGLDNQQNDFASGLYEYQATPPPFIWNNISEELNKNNQSDISSRLFNLEVNPPTATWQKIKSSLDEKEEAPVVFLKNKDAVPIWKYAVAAAVIGLIAFSLVWLNNDNGITQTNISLIDKNAKPAIKNPSLPESNPPSSEILSNQLPAETQGQNNNPSIIAKANYNTGHYNNKPVYASAYMDEPKNTPVQLANSFSVNDFEERVQPMQYGSRINTYNPSQVSNNNPYVMFISPDGYMVRISKKLAGMIGCIYNDNTLGNQDCKEKLQLWREKVAKSPITPTPGNFMDILDLVKTLQENKP